MSDSGTSIETYTGHRVDPFDLSPDDVCLEDVAASLAHTCRFGGHCTHFYSVAHHSLHVSREVSQANVRLQLFGLLHDAAEAYLGDIPRPFKRELERVERTEARILDAVWTALEIEPPTATEWERVMAADDRLLAYEAASLLEDGSWADDPPALEYDLRSDSIDAVRERFLARSESLLARLE